MGSFYSYIKEHKTLTIGIVSLSLLGTAGIVYKKQQSSKILDDSYRPQTTYHDDMKISRKFNPFDEKDTLYTRISNFGKYDSIKDAIQVNYLPQSNCLEPQTIVDILQYTIELAGDEFIKITIKNRATRRALKQNNKINQYKHQILQYNEDIEELLEKSQAELLQRLGISKTTFEESMLSLMERGFFQQLYMLQASVKQKIKEKIPSNKDLTLKQIKEVIKYNIRILREQPEPFQYIVNSMISKQDQKEYTPNAINLIVQDFTFEKYRLEEEDQIRNISKNECMGDPEIHQLLGELEATMTDVMNQLGLGGIESLPENFENFT